ncbi:molybdopterin-dependent oxidoreductase [Methanoculleus sp. UBA303]|jgi:DMSO/TMAO reductase YedYZ molybdopterin-dependent catalytic subunit|uniref:molybdopterin-dependent oxidoreductase n=1 Tax=Methanoculleus sp. UBA303 TaxID=1915497 RepID=UPI0025E77046|nr:molybdopterin-dependent oxidoreductase [Methanoculleus sp. UBA303]
MRRGRRTGQIIVILLVGAIAVLYALDLAENRQGATELAPAEVREYQGERLSSIADFRENSIRGPQHVNASTYTLTVDGLVENREEYSYSALMERFPHYRKVVTLYCVEGWDVTILWEGIRVKDLLEEAGVKPGANTVIFYAEDGYSSSLPLAYIEDRDILLAYAMNNVTLPAERGFPFQLVAEDRWGYKWVKWVNRIEVSDDANYRGYWESRGYANNGSLDRSFFDQG